MKESGRAAFVAASSVLKRFDIAARSR